MPIVRLEGSLTKSEAVGHVHAGHGMDCLYWREEAWTLTMPVTSSAKKIIIIIEKQRKA